MSPNGGETEATHCSCFVVDSGGGGVFHDVEGGNNDSFSDLAEQSDLQSHLQLCFTSLSEAPPPPNNEKKQTRFGDVRSSAGST